MSGDNKSGLPQLFSLHFYAIYFVLYLEYWFSIPFTLLHMRIGILTQINQGKKIAAKHSDGILYTTTTSIQQF